MHLVFGQHVVTKYCDIQLPLAPPSSQVPGTKMYEATAALRPPANSWFGNILRRRSSARRGSLSISWESHKLEATVKYQQHNWPRSATGAHTLTRGLVTFCITPRVAPLSRRQRCKYTAQSVLQLRQLHES